MGLLGLCAFRVDVVQRWAPRFSVLPQVGMAGVVSPFLAWGGNGVAVSRPFAIPLFIKELQNVLSQCDAFDCR